MSTKEEALNRLKEYEKENPEFARITYFLKEHIEADRLDQLKLYEEIISDTEKFIKNLKNETDLTFFQFFDASVRWSVWLNQPENSVENIINKACVGMEKALSSISELQGYASIYNVVRSKLVPEEFNAIEAAGIIMMGSENFKDALYDALYQEYYHENIQGTFYEYEEQIQKHAMEYIQNACESFYLEHINELDRDGFSQECLNIIGKAAPYRGRGE